jgi:hypothetical protein
VGFTGADRQQRQGFYSTVLVRFLKGQHVQNVR